MNKCWFLSSDPGLDRAQRVLSLSANAPVPVSLSSAFLEPAPADGPHSGSSPCPS